MGFGTKHSVTLTTVGTSSNVTAYTTDIGYGYVNRITFRLGTMTTTADITITTADSSITIWQQSNIIAAETSILPRMEIVTTTGTTAGTKEPIMVVNERIKVVVDNAGDAKTGTVEIIVT